MWTNLERGSSPVDWCESNYLISPFIAEFVNAITNVPFFVLPILLIHLFKEYSRRVTPAINVLWILFMTIGICSLYFHATLSLVGQLLDEIAILWLCTATLTIFYPTRMFPKFLKGSRRIFGWYTTVFTILFTACSIVYPAINAFALMLFYIPTIYYTHLALKIVQCGRVFRLALRSGAISCLALFCWIIDRTLCSMWLSINFPYFHGLWHIFICISGYTFLVLAAYLHVIEERPDQKPQLRYWPVNEFELGVPYVTVKYSHRSEKDLEI